MNAARDEYAEPWWPTLKDVGLQIDTFVQQPLFGLKSRVTHEERAQRSILHEYDQRMFIDIIRAVGELRVAQREKRQRYFIIEPMLMTPSGNVCTRSAGGE